MPLFAAFVTVTDHATHEHLDIATPDRRSVSPKGDARPVVRASQFTRPGAFGVPGIARQPFAASAGRPGVGDPYRAPSRLVWADAPVGRVDGVLAITSASVCNTRHLDGGRRRRSAHCRRDVLGHRADRREASDSGGSLGQTPESAAVAHRWSAHLRAVGGGECASANDAIMTACDPTSCPQRVREPHYAKRLRRPAKSE